MKKVKFVLLALAYAIALTPIVAVVSILVGLFELLFFFWVDALKRLKAGLKFLDMIKEAQAEQNQPFSWEDYAARKEAERQIQEKNNCPNPDIMKN